MKGRRRASAERISDTEVWQKRDTMVMDLTRFQRHLSVSCRTKGLTVDKGWPRSYISWARK